MSSGSGSAKRSVGLLLAVVVVLAGVPLAATPVAAGPEDGEDTATGEPVTVTVTRDSQPEDAQIVVRDDSGSVVTVRYTDPHNPGRAVIKLEPGEYEFGIDAGGGFVAEKVYRNVTVDGPESLSVEVPRTYEPNDRGYYAADLHAHSIYSVDTNDSPMDEFVAAQLAADVDVLFISDHNSVRGHRPLRQHAEERRMPYLLSDELSTEADAGEAIDRTPTEGDGTYGHFNVYPIAEGEPVDWTGTPDDFFGAARDAGAIVIQANHPRRDDNYFHHIGEPDYNESYETAEAYNDDFTGDERETVQQLFAFWNRGYRYTATAVSDDHESSDIGDEYGNPRTYAYMEQPPTRGGVASDYARAVEDGHVFITYGPLVYFRSETGAIPGENVSAEDGEVTLTAEIRNVGELERATLVRNGTAIRNYTLSGETATIEHTTDIEGTKWYVLRVRDEQGAIGTRAMTNPIWVSTGRFEERGPSDPVRKERARDGPGEGSKAGTGAMAAVGDGVEAVVAGLLS